jgi:pilus assembly protein CpaB
MKGTRALIVLFLALVCGIGAMLVGASWLTNKSPTSAGLKVLVAARDIPLGSPLETAMIQEIPWAAETLPTGAYSDTKLLEGRVVKTTLLRGEPILEGRLAPIGTKGGLSALISEGKRAITVRVNEVVGVAGFALPGNYVDVMVNTHDDKQSQVSKIVLERILVLAVDQGADRDETKPKVVNAVTLEVTPVEAEKIDLARSIGSLSLVLRNQVDTKDATTSGTRSADLLNFKVAPPVVPARPKIVRQAPPPPVVVEERPRVEVIRGLQRSESEL